jgi:hypothetical protein
MVGDPGLEPGTRKLLGAIYVFLAWPCEKIYLRASKLIRHYIRMKYLIYSTNLVGLPGLEPGTSSLSVTRSNQLSYSPVLQIC